MKVAQKDVQCTAQPRYRAFTEIAAGLNDESAQNSRRQIGKACQTDFLQVGFKKSQVVAKMKEGSWPKPPLLS